jgi:hypothetical protein
MTIIIFSYLYKNEFNFENIYLTPECSGSLNIWGGALIFMTSYIIG